MKYQILCLFLLLISCTKSQNDTEVYFSVNSGDTLSKVTQRLIDEKIIDDFKMFRLTAKLSGQSSKLKIGNYIIPPHSSYYDILKILSSGRDSGIRITIPEGFNSFDIGALLEKNNIISSNDFIKEIGKPEYLIRYNIPSNSAQTLEGYLFPDTYNFSINSHPETVVKTILSRFDKIITPDILTNLKEQNKTLHQLLTFASIVEKESGGNSEMGLIAGVYTKRLAIGMKMQADPTLIYALILENEYDGNIRYKHLRPPWPSPYNTYHTYGTPPGPIANPGKPAILASLSPEPTSYLYFVGKGDGTHIFSKTLVEHNLAVEQYQRKKQ